MLFLENLISGFFPFSFLMVAGIYLSVKTAFPQLTRFKESFVVTKNALKSGWRTMDITSFKSACTALSATVGTGNIAGVAGAISIGGAGAVFWMWISAVLGMCIKSAEITLAVIYRNKTTNGYVGGPMYYIEKGLGKGFRVLGFAFCITAIPTVICSGNITQTNAAIHTFCEGDFQRIIWGIIFFVACLFSVLGGFKRITQITENLVPFMSFLYIALCLLVIFENFDSLPRAFAMIFKGAFCPKAVTGGAVGSVFLCAFTGASRGIFSNEAGLGTSAMAHAVAVDANPKTQGLFGIFEVFADTIVLCTLTALTILCSGVKIEYGKIASTELVSKALYSVLGNFGSIALGVMMCLFAFSSIVGWSLYGKLCIEYLFKRFNNTCFAILYPSGCIAGALFDAALAWRLAAITNGIMLCINLFVILLLSSKVFNFLKREKKH